jgi:hypothetical protein
MKEVNKELQNNISTTHYLLKSEVWCQSGFIILKMFNFIVVAKLEVNFKNTQKKEVEKSFKTQMEWAK